VSNGVDGLVRNLKHVPVGILQNTGDDGDRNGDGHPDYIVAPHHARDLWGALEYWDSDQDNFYREFAGSHTTEPPTDDQEDLMIWLAEQSLNVDHSQITIKTDESKDYYWLYIDQSVEPSSPHWTAVDAFYDAASGVITATVTDEEYRAGLRFDLLRMGLDPAPAYIVEDRDLRTNALALASAEPDGDWLAVSTSGSGEHQLVVYPQMEHRHIEIVQDAEATYDTYLDGWNRTATDQYDDSKLLLRKDDVYSPLIKFVDFAGIPAGSRILSAVVRLYVLRAVGDPPADQPVDAYGVNRAWVDSEASYNQAQNSDAWAQPGCNGLLVDREASPSSNSRISGSGTWCGFDVTGLAQDWLDDPAGNQGLILKWAGNDYHGQGLYELASSDHETPSWRPQVLIYYEYVPPTPTPTASATPTITPSATLILTATPTKTVTQAATATPTVTWTPTLAPLNHWIYLPVMGSPGA
jgi:hypothetical protein